MDAGYFEGLFGHGDDARGRTARGLGAGGLKSADLVGKVPPPLLAEIRPEAGREASHAALYFGRC